MIVQSSRIQILLASAVASIVAGSAAAAPEMAEYRVTFDATWSAATHPTDFPPGPHFSPPIGVTHDAGVSFWQVGGLASPGIEAMAETGATSPLDQEIAAAITAGTAMDSFVRPGLVSPGSTTGRFDVYHHHSRVTLVSMIAPTPDWFVGVSGLDLRPNGQWVDDFVVQLSPYDAGTDDGVTFLSPDADTDPQEPIALITGYPFQGTPPLGTFTFELLSVTPLPAQVPAMAPGMVAATAVLMALGSRGRRASPHG